MSILLLMFTPAAPSFSELAATLASFPGLSVSPTDCFDELAICDPDGADRARCLRLLPGLRDSAEEARRVAKHWPAGLAPEEVAILRIDYQIETIDLVRHALTELSSRFRYFVETTAGQIFTAGTFARRSAREPGAWWERLEAAPDGGRLVETDSLPASPGSTAAAAVEPLPSLDEIASGQPAGAEGFPAWRPLGDWSPPRAGGQGNLAVLTVASLPSGPAIEIGGRVVPGLLGWFARQLRAWEANLRTQEPDRLRRPAAYLFVAARAAGAEAARGRERVAWYPGLVVSGHGYGDSTNGPAGCVDLRLDELIERAARMLEGD
jgi:hypothetical protein